MAYGKTQESNYLQGGVNSNVFLTKFTKTAVSTSLYQGDVIDIEISNGSSSVSKRLFPVSPSDPNFDKRSTDQTTWLYQIVGKFCSKADWDAAMNRVTDFNSLYEECRKLLPANFEKVPAKVVLTYVEKTVNDEKKHYLELPNVHWLNKPWGFFAIGDEELGVSNKIIVNRPETTSQPTPDTVPGSSDFNGHDDPF